MELSVWSLGPLQARGDPDDVSVVDKLDDTGELGDGTPANCGWGKARGVGISEGRGRNRAVWLKQKSMSWMKNLVTKVSKGG